RTPLHIGVGRRAGRHVAGRALDAQREEIEGGLARPRGPRRLSARGPRPGDPTLLPHAQQPTRDRAAGRSLSPLPARAGRYRRGIIVMHAPNHWHSTQIHYYDDDKDGLLLDAVRPLIDDVAADVERVFFVRHWLRGPHVRLCVLAGDDVFRAR